MSFDLMLVFGALYSGGPRGQVRPVEAVHLTSYGRPRTISMTTAALTPSTIFADATTIDTGTAAADRGLNS